MRKQGLASASRLPPPDLSPPDRRVIGRSPWRFMSVAPRQGAGRDSVSVPYSGGGTGTFRALRRRLRVPVMGHRAGGWILGGFLGAGLERLLAGGDGVPFLAGCRASGGVSDCVDWNAPDAPPWLSVQFTGMGAVSEDAPSFLTLTVTLLLLKPTRRVHRLCLFTTRASYVVEFESWRHGLHFIEPSFSCS